MPEQQYKRVRDELLRFLSLACAARGAALSDLSSIDMLCDPQTVKAVIASKNDDGYNVARLSVLLAEHALNVEPDDYSELIRLRAERSPVRDEISVRQQSVLQALTTGNFRRLREMDELIAALARGEKDPPIAGPDPLYLAIVLRLSTRFALLPYILSRTYVRRAEQQADADYCVDIAIGASGTATITIRDRSSSKLPRRFPLDLATADCIRRYVGDRTGRLFEGWMGHPRAIGREIASVLTTKVSKQASVLDLPAITALRIYSDRRRSEDERREIARVFLGRVFDQNDRLFASIAALLRD